MRVTHFCMAHMPGAVLGFTLTSSLLQSVAVVIAQDFPFLVCQGRIITRAGRVV